jgi:HSP20 family molecular chaperone IbpA
MQKRFTTVWEEMDVLMERLMEETFAGFPTRNYGIQMAVDGNSHNDSCSCGKSGIPEDIQVEPVTEVHRTPDTLTVVAELPGANEQGITLDLRSDTLVIEADSGDIHYRATADIRNAPVGPMKSSFRNGVLEVTFQEAATG